MRPWLIEGAANRILEILRKLQAFLNFLQSGQYLIKRGRIGCVPGVDFGPHGEGFVRFCFARERSELTGALDAMQELFSANRSATATEVRAQA